MSVTEFGYKAFISYSHADKAWAEWLLKSLESYRVPSNLVGRRTDFGPIPARLAPIFRDRDELPAAHRLTDRLFEALRASEFLIVLCSPRAAKSKLVNREIVEFKKTHGDGRVLCMIVDGVPFAKDPEQECFPEALLHSFLADGSRGGLSAEGLAADIRAEGDGKRMGLLKVVAGMIGVGLNDLVRRDEQRRQRNMIAVAAAAFFGMSVMGTLTYEAQKARDKAAKAQMLAEAQQAALADELRHNDALLYDLMSIAYERMLEHGNLDTLEKITTRVLETFKGRDLDSLSPVQFSHYTGSMLRFGQNLDRQGHSERAGQIFSEVLTLSRRYYEKNPMMSEAIFRYQNNLFFTGYLALRQGRFDDAERDYRKRLEINEFAISHKDELSAAKGLHLRTANLWKTRLADSQMGLAHLLGVSGGRVEEAIPLHRSSIALYRELVENEPEDPELLVQLASAYHYAGQTYMQAGRLDDAQSQFDKRLAIFETMLAAKPDNYRVLRRLMMTKQSLARIALYRGQAAQAYKMYEEATQGFNRLVAKDPSNTMWLADSAKAFVDLAEAALRLGELETSGTALANGTAQIKEAVKRDATRPNRWLTHYRAEALEASLLRERGKHDAALASVAKTLEALANESEQYHAMSGTREHHAQALMLEAQLLADASEPEKSKDRLQKIVATLGEATGNISLRGKETLAQAHLLLGNQDKARTLSRELADAGYLKPQDLSDNTAIAR